ncbi:MAG: hypothetical protein C0421_08625 [Hyphomonas sp.]|nr:hypothetical protein [Hyphomonas sp.]
MTLVRSGSQPVAVAKRVPEIARMFLPFRKNSRTGTPCMLKTSHTVQLQHLDLHAVSNLRALRIRLQGQALVQR